MVGYAPLLLAFVSGGILDPEVAVGTHPLEGFLHNTDSITDRISTLSDNLNSLASWISSASQVPLLID